MCSCAQSEKAGATGGGDARGEGGGGVGAAPVTVSPANGADASLAPPLSKPSSLELPASLEHVPETIAMANPSPDVLMDFWVPWCDFYIHISVPADGAPRVSIPLELPAFAERPEAAASGGGDAKGEGAAAAAAAVDAATAVEDLASE